MHRISKKKFNCEICEKCFTSNKSKKQHLSVVHGEEKKFSCNVCNSTFGSKQLLTSHIETNHQHGNHICKECGRVFPTSETRHSQCNPEE